MPSSSASLSLDQYLLALVRMTISDVSRDEFLGLTRMLAIDPAIIERRVAFSQRAYARNFVVRSPEFELLVLCWEPGQTTTVHDHAGSLNFIRVHHGRLTSRLFARSTDGGLDLVSEETLEPAAHTAVDRPEIHQLANLSNDRLITVHVYAPPLRKLRVYDVDTGRARFVSLRYTVTDDLS